MPAVGHGESGYPPSLLARAGCATSAAKNGLLLIIDEMQSGFGWTGRMFNVEYSGAQSDLLTMAKVALLCRFIIRGDVMSDCDRALQMRSAQCYD